MKGLSRRVEGHITEWDTAEPKFLQVLDKTEPHLSLHSLLLVLTPLHPSDVFAQALTHSTGHPSQDNPIKDLCSQPVCYICYCYVKFTRRACK